MSINIIKRPITLVNGHQSKWLSAHQPITFDVERRDVTIVGLKYIFSNGKPNQIILVINFDANVFKVKVGQKIQVFTGKNSKTFTITSMLSGNQIVVAYDNLPTFGSTIVFLDINYYIETTIYAVDNTTIYRQVGTIKNKTNTLGIAKVSVQDLLSTKCANQNNFKYNQINQGLAEEGSRFNIKIVEYYNGIALGGKIDIVKANLHYYTNSANQIQNTYGYNMGEYVPTLDATRTDKAKFQSVFKRPTYFTGYPFSLNFIYSDNMLNYQLIRKEETKDINGNIITNTSANLNISQREAANRLMLNGSYTSNIKTLDIWLETGAIVTEQTYVDFDYTDSGYFALTLPSNEYTKSLYE